ncbi:MAG: MMPL family transporter, partial [Actinomycetota bacterium]|nr:MMPL family transporter [Actinomycetota bacterium]
MSRLLYRVGWWCARHPWRTVSLWFVAVAAAVGLSVTVGGTLEDDYQIPGSSTQRATDLLTERFPEMSGTEARVVVHARAGRLDPESLRAGVASLERLPHVSSVAPPRLSSDGRTAVIGVQYGVPVTEFRGDEGVEALRQATAPLVRAGLQVEYGGQLPENINEPSGLAEGVGVVSALVILLLAFGSVVAAGLPLAIAFAGLAVGVSGISFLALVTSVSPVSPTLATMVGLGVGIDYALFIVTRHREALASGSDVPEAAARANATAGLSVLFAGGTVIIAICALVFCGLPILATMGFATALVVAAVVVAAVTLLPALLGLAGGRVLGRRRTSARGRHARGSGPNETRTAAGRSEWAAGRFRGRWPP